jgi:lipoate-protein ligase A
MPGSSIPCRLLLDLEPRPGTWNMAVDELLLEQAVESGACALRWYRWDCPTLSLGYFQDPDQVPDVPGMSLPVVRRLSGGGAIIHDREVTYSCAIPAGHPLTQSPRELYMVVHQAIVDVLTGLGVPVRFRGESESDKAGEFLCFGRGDGFDVILGEHKVLGSAQRRRKGAILQHGSLVLQRSPVAPQFPGIADLAELSLPIEVLAERLASAVGSVLSTTVGRGDLSSEELRLLADRRRI